MSIQPTEAVNSSLFGSTASTTAASSTTDKDMFLQLMVAQMRYQDPLNPSDSTAFLAQTAQFTALEKMQDVADQSAMLLASQNAFGASGLVGRTVAWSDASGVLTQGTVDGVSFGADGPVLDINGTQVSLGAVVQVRASAAADATESA